MTVLVTAASKHGATAEIAEAIARELEEQGVATDVAEPDEVSEVSDYDAVVLGSAVYLGRWLDPARRLADEQAEALSQRPTWLFSSGPIVHPTAPEDEDVKDAKTIAERIGAREHRVFVGRLDRSQLNLCERIAVRAAKAEDGDGRDWDEIARWADEIAATLRETR